MDELVIPLSIICGTAGLTVLGGIALWLRSQRLVEREKNERIILVEQEKTAREERKAEAHRLTIERDIVASKIDAGLMSPQQSEDDGGFGGILKTFLPVIASNPDILKNLFSKGANQTAQGVNTGNNAQTFPADIVQSGGVTQ